MIAAIERPDGRAEPGVAVHELSVCQALLTQVTEIVAGRGGVEVARITIEVGPLSGVDAALLSTAFTVLCAGSCAASATLSIEATAVEIACQTCGVESQTAPNRLVCASCGGYRVRVVSGEELRLRRIEFRIPQRVSAA
jgi:hydrogenase nickel incorporation protein HypA/HybF